MNQVFDKYLYSHNHIKGCWEYHLEWCPKYRFNAMKDSPKQELMEKILLSVAKELDVEVLELAVMPDHVHILVRCKKPLNPSYLLFRFKGRTSHDIFEAHPNFRKRYSRGHFWSRGSFSRTIGVDVEVEREYVRNQVDIHQTKLSSFG